MTAKVVAVSRSGKHTFTKPNVLTVRLIAGVGIEGDAHAGETVKHRSRVRQNPNLPNLRQVHFMHAELLDELAAAGFGLAPGEIGENITTRGVDLLALPTGTLLRLGPDAIVQVTGLRNPCSQLDKHRAGLMKALLGRDTDGGLIRKSGVMGIVIADGDVKAGDDIRVELPAGSHTRLDVV